MCGFNDARGGGGAVQLSPRYATPMKASTALKKRGVGSAGRPVANILV